MKLIEIPFDASLIGQEGIVVKTKHGKEVKQLTYFICDDVYKVIGVVGSEIINWTAKGEEWNEETSDCDLLMYRESKVMTVEEWKYTKQHSAYMHNGWLLGVEELAAAIKNGEVEI